MQFCPSHWDALKKAIDNAGLSTLIAVDGKRAMQNLASEATEGLTVDNFDPLMAAHNAILANAMDLAKERYHADPLGMMFDDPAHPERACPICYLNSLHAHHDEHCTQPNCDYPRGYTWDEYFITHAVEGAAEQWRELRS